ncbi:DUF5107 domain-containing protein [Echinicola arenosa]|nr:DUF5107 domain-containing protein [Echinicola arenosa]
MSRMAMGFFLMFLVHFSIAQETVRSREFLKEYVTYPFSDPDPVPADKKLYPYFRFDGFTDEGTVKKWKVVELENDFIKVQIMPEIGGKVWTAYDKVHQKYFLYNNEVVKFRDIAMRGPWVSGGIEANYGTIGHTPNSATSVDYLLKENSDGSQSCFVSTLDLLTRTRWVLEIKLEKDKAYFSTKSFWFNSTGNEQPYYTWMNAGIPASDDLTFLYPGTHYIGHDGKAHDWPIDEQGKDLSRYSNNDFGGSKSYHVTGAHSSYFGARWELADFGMIRYSNREDKLGKKIFLWAQSDQGKIWEDLLTDHSGQYVEIQSGRLFNQNVFNSSFTPFKQIGFLPYAAEKWTEYWYSFGDMEGFTHANLLGAYNIQIEESEVRFAFSPVKAVKDTLKIFNSAGEILAAELIDSKPLSTINHVLVCPNANQISYLELGGQRVDLQKDRKKSLSRPLKIAENYDAESAYGLYMQARDLYRFRDYLLAEQKLETALEKNDTYIPALVEMAKLKLYRMNYDAAFTYVKQALSIDTYDPEANYYYGLIADRLSLDYDAMDGFEVASLSPQFRNAAYTALSKLNLKKHNLIGSRDMAMKAMVQNSSNIEALRILYLLYRLENKQLGKEEIESKLVELNPLDHFIRFEQYFHNKDDAKKADFVSLIKSELAHETFLELGIWYASVGRLQESIGVLELAPKNAEILYWLAWLTKETPRSDAFFREAEKADLAYVFPFREESVKVLEWASNKESSWKPKYLLALIHDFRGNRKEAAALMGSERVDFAPYHVLQIRIQESATIEEKVAYAEQAIAIDPKEWRYQKILAALLSQQGKKEESVKVIQNTYKENNTNYVVGLELVKGLMKIDQYLDAERILNEIKVLPFEGATDARKYYRQTKMMLAYQALEEGEYSKALNKIEEIKLWPNNLGVGRPYPELINDKLENSLKQIVTQKMVTSGLKGNIPQEGLGKERIDEKSLIKEIKSLSFEADQRMF